MSDEQERSPKRGMCAAILSLEAIVLGLTTPVMINLANVPWQTAVSIGLGLCVACLVLAGLLRSEAAYGVGWVIQVAAVALGFVVPMMFVLGVDLRAAVGHGVLPGTQDRARASRGVRRLRGRASRLTRSGESADHRRQSPVEVVVGAAAEADDQAGEPRRTAVVAEQGDLEARLERSRADP